MNTINHSICPYCHTDNGSSSICPSCSRDIDEYNYANKAKQKKMLEEYQAQEPSYHQSPSETPPDSPQQNIYNETKSNSSTQTDALALYRALLEMVWVNHKLDQFMISHLQEKAKSINLSAQQKKEIEREVIGRSIQEQLYYEKLLEARDTNGNALLSALQDMPGIRHELNLPTDSAHLLEQEVFGSTVVEIALQQRHQENFQANEAQYKIALNMAWADQILTQQEIDYLVSVANQLNLSNETQKAIELAVLGCTKEQKFLGQETKRLLTLADGYLATPIENAPYSTKLTIENQYSSPKASFTNTTFKPEKRKSISKISLRPYGQIHHDGVVADLAFSPNSQLLATASQNNLSNIMSFGLLAKPDNNVRIWNINNLDLYRKLQHPDARSGSPNCIRFSPDGNWLETACDDKIVRLWNIAGQLFRKYEGHTDIVKSVAISHDDKWFISASSDKTIRLWDSKTRQCLKVLTGHSKTINAIVISSDDKYLVSASDDKTIGIWEIKTGQCVRVLVGHTEGVNSVAISPNGNLIASSGSFDNTVRLWDFTTGQCLQVLKGNEKRALYVAFSQDGSWLASRDHGAIRLWNATNGECLYVLEIDSTPILDLSGSIAISPDNKWLATITNFHDVQLYEIVDEIEWSF